MMPQQRLHSTCGGGKCCFSEAGLCQQTYPTGMTLLFSASVVWEPGSSLHGPWLPGTPGFTNQRQMQTFFFSSIGPAT